MEKSQPISFNHISELDILDKLVSRLSSIRETNRAKVNNLLILSDQLEAEPDATDDELVSLPSLVDENQQLERRIEQQEQRNKAALLLLDSSVLHIDKCASKIRSFVALHSEKALQSHRADIAEIHDIQAKNLSLTCEYAELEHCLYSVSQVLRHSLRDYD